LIKKEIEISLTGKINIAKFEFKPKELGFITA
jgi:hypothetical protein